MRNLIFASISTVALLTLAACDGANQAPQSDAGAATTTTTPSTGTGTTTTPGTTTPGTTTTTQ